MAVHQDPQAPGDTHAPGVDGVLELLRRSDPAAESVRELLAWTFQASQKGWALVKDHQVVATNPRFGELDRHRPAGRWTPVPSSQFGGPTVPSNRRFDSLRALVLQLSSSVASASYQHPARFARNGQVIECRVEKAPRARPHAAALVIVRDITRVARLEDALDAARERLVKQEALRAIGEVASGVGHDLTNVLGALRFLTESLANAVRANGAASRDADNILRAAGQASALAARLLDVGRPALGPPVLVDLRQAIHDAVELGHTACRLRSHRGGAPFRILVHASQLPKVNGRPGDLQRVFLNLLLNAKDAMPDGGMVTICAKVSRRAVLVSVEDEGPGIPVAKQVIESVGGSISAGNRRRGGARIELRFPIPETPERQRRRLGTGRRGLGQVGRVRP